MLVFMQAHLTGLQVVDTTGSRITAYNNIRFEYQLK